ncbi:TonB-dependent receptor [Aurantivibrio plasticivorans]
MKQPVLIIPLSLIVAVPTLPAVADETMDNIVVTSTREEKDISDLSESVGVINKIELDFIDPGHPSEALNRVAGVHINNLGGEGHMTSIRQPITTAGVYLFLEDGIPTRPTGFFNHNGLYEINIPQSSRVEVIKGPGSALYGSDAIGGVINAITSLSPNAPILMANAEGGSFGWRRGLLSAGTNLGESSGVRVDYNTTRSDGFRDEAAYDRQSLNVRVDSTIGDITSVKLITSFSDIDQSGVSSLEYNDYKSDTEKNQYHGDIGFRVVEAGRASAEFNIALNESNLITATPFYRKNEMTMMPSWMVTYDPNIRDYTFESYGLLLKYRYALADNRAEFIVGVDVDSTPSEYLEEEIIVAQNGDIYTDYQRTGNIHYDFDADQRSVSPYVHAEYQITDQVRLNAGVRFDSFTVDYDNNIVNGALDFSHRRPESQSIDYDNTSPKLGLTYQYAENHHAYFSYRHAFRAPTVGALFRPGSSQNSTELKPVQSVSTEIGFRGDVLIRDGGSAINYEVVIYDMAVEDDIVSIINDGSRESVNAGETSHRGVELGVDALITPQWQLGFSYTYTEQTYDDFSYVFFSRDCFCNQQINFAGNDVALAPESLGNIRLGYTPDLIQGLRAELEFSHVGSYATDQTNTQRYDGHDLWNFRVNYSVNDAVAVYVRVMNIGDVLYSTYTSNQVNDPDLSYRPGNPRTVFAGLRVNF